MGQLITSDEIFSIFDYWNQCLFFLSYWQTKRFNWKNKCITSEFWCIQVIKSMWWSKKYNICAHSVVERKNKVAIKCKCSSASTSNCASVVLTLKLCCFGCWVPAHTADYTEHLNQLIMSQDLKVSAFSLISKTDLQIFIAVTEWCVWFFYIWKHICIYTPNSEIHLIIKTFEVPNNSTSFTVMEYYRRKLLLFLTCSIT